MGGSSKPPAPDPELVKQREEERKRLEAENQKLEDEQLESRRASRTGGIRSLLGNSGLQGFQSGSGRSLLG